MADGIRDMFPDEESFRSYQARRNAEANLWMSEAFARGDMTEEKVRDGWTIDVFNEIVAPPGYQPNDNPNRPGSLTRQRAYAQGMNDEEDNLINLRDADNRAVAPNDAQVNSSSPDEQENSDSDFSDSDSDSSDSDG